MKRVIEKVAVVFTKDCEIFKKGEEKSFSPNLASQLVNVEKVAKFKTK